METKNTRRERTIAVSCLGACVYALLFAVGSQIDRTGETALRTGIVRFFAALPLALLALYALFAYALPAWERRAHRRAIPQKEEKPFCTPGAWALIFASYVPLFLIEYPGSFMYDTQRQVFQIARGEYEMFHPLAHTLLIRACLSLYGVLQSYEKCAAVYSAVQMLIMSGCFALLCASLSRSRTRKAARFAAAFFCLYPAHMAFASNCTKDGLFSAFFALLLAYCVEYAEAGRLCRLHSFLLVLSGALACLLRNNMIYAMAAWLALLLLFAVFAAKKYLRLIGMGALAIALSLGMNAGLAKWTNAAPGSRIEMLSVPIQQLSRARLLREDCFTEEEKALMDEVFVDALYDTPEKLYTHYEPTLADPVKNYLDEQLVLERFGELAAMWTSVGAKCPGVYLDAFWNLALPSLYPYSEYRVAQPYIETGLQPGVVTAPFGLPPMSQPGRFEGLRSWVYEHVYATGVDDVPLVRYLFNTGFVFWILLLLYLYELCRGREDGVLMLLLPLLLYATYLLGPVMQGRYLYPFVCALPVFASRRARSA